MPEPVAPNPALASDARGETTRRVVMIGPVTWDEIDGVRVPGGALSFAARTAEAFGVQLRLLVLAGPDADLEALSGHEVVVVQGESTLTMVHDIVDGERSIRVPVTAGRTVGAADVPEDWSGCSDLVLAPLMPDELDAPAIVEAVDAERLWVLAQGFQRVHAADGAISFLERPAKVLGELAGAATTVFLSNDETDPWPAGDVEALAARCELVIVTQGAAGALVMSPEMTVEVSPAAAEAVIDTTGAGDVFATAFLLALDGVGADVGTAGRLAAGFAAAAVEVSGPGPLPTRAAIEARLKQQPGAAGTPPAGGAA